MRKFERPSITSWRWWKKDLFTVRQISMVTQFKFVWSCPSYVSRYRRKSEYKNKNTSGPDMIPNQIWGVMQEIFHSHLTDVLRSISWKTNSVKMEEGHVYAKPKLSKRGKIGCLLIDRFFHSTLLKRSSSGHWARNTISRSHYGFWTDIRQ